jgi:hypothetical protein
MFFGIEVVFLCLNYAKYPTFTVSGIFSKRCSTRSTVTAKRQAMASPENQRAATDPNNDLDLALNFDLDLDRDLDSPTATAFSAAAVVPGTGRAAPSAPSCISLSPPEAPNLKKYREEVA